MKNSSYDFKVIEQKWQKFWDDNKTWKSVPVTGEPSTDSAKYPKGKFYTLVEFPYPSAQGLHIGHPRPYTAMDIVSRKKRLEGYNVMFPFGWDAFGLPTENYAIKTKIHPAKVTADNIASFKRQAKSIGLSVDWDREVNTTDPAYYKWTQWIFLQMFKKGLAYKKEMAVNWCTSCKVVLANEEVVAGQCERCHGDVVRKVKSQWMLKITEYAQRLIDDLETVDYADKIKSSQLNWIGRSVGAEVDFNVAGIGDISDTLKIYTTRADTLFGATYMVIAPEHPLVETYKARIKNYGEVAAYREAASRKSDFERAELAKDKTGVRIDGITAINPVNGKALPIFVSDYVLMTYGTGAIMAVPAHDTRDFEFAKIYGCDIIQVIAPATKVPPVGEWTEAFTDVASGTLVNSGFLDGLSVAEAKTAITDYLVKEGKGTAKVNFKLRDWVFSRQRYWGEPIPMVWCETCGWVPVPEEELPLKLPEVDSYMPTDDGSSPLSALDSFINCKCPKCGADAKRETDTMPQWAGSSWYFLRYCDPHNDRELISKAAQDYYMSVDWYNGGMEHTTLHLLYSRFWHKFLYDIGVVNTAEPYKRRTSHGMILGEDGQKMSKSRGNVISPDDVIREHGTDALRLYEMFAGDFEKAAKWSNDAIRGCRRLLERAWGMREFLRDGNSYSDELRAPFHKTIKKVSEDIENLKFNTAIAALMSLTNEIYAKKSVNNAEFRAFLTLLNPFAPHITEELFFEVFGEYAHKQKWCVYDEALCKDDVVEIAVQICGKVRGKLNVPAAATAAEMIALAKETDAFKAVAGKTIVKEIAVPGKLVNIVVR